MLRNVISLLLFSLLLACPPLRAQTPAPIEGFTEPFHKVDLSPAEPGILMQLLVKEGDTVKCDDKLAVLDTDVIEINLRLARKAMESRGRVDAAKAERAIRAERLTRLKSLQTQGYAFRDEIDRAAADLEVAEANVLIAEEQKALETLEHEKAVAMLEQRTIRSPLDGVVTKIYRERREYITASEPVVLTVMQLDPLRIVFAVPTAEAIKLRRDQKVGLGFPDSDDHAQGRIELVSPITDAESGMVRVKVLLANPEGKYRCGVRSVLMLNAASKDSHVLRTSAKP